MKKNSLSVNFCGVKFENPLILASGFMGISASSLSYVEKSRAGGVTTKSIGHLERMGHTSPTVLAWSGNILNAVGLSNPGIDQSLPILAMMQKKIKVPLIISFFADTDTNYAKVAQKIVTLKPKLIEVNASCPNTQDDLGAPFAVDSNALKILVRKVRKVVPKSIKMIVKLSPNVPDISIMGKIAESEGADAICAVNTVPGMIIDIYARRPVLTNKSGGVSGKAIKPVAVKAVYDLYKAIKIPIIGLGGVETGQDALEMIMVGATLVGVGSAIYSRGMKVFKHIQQEMTEIMKDEGIKNLESIKGAAHG
ncbi:dihydroorotate dehydrogenase [Candidatus Gottesmanbacteria bacterium]|nr:dihydroorotate dehydrogenase [Candidatus Gottesmanbacteria bacterium]